MGSSHLPLLSLSGATAISNEEREHPDQKTEAKEPCQDQELLRCEWRGEHTLRPLSLTLTLSLMGVLQLVGGGADDVSWPNHGT